MNEELYDTINYMNYSTGEFDDNYKDSIESFKTLSNLDFCIISKTT